MLIDMHVHTAEASPCSNICAVELVQLYKQKGYDGFVVTDHFLKYYMETSFKAEYEDYCRIHYDAFLSAKEEGEKAGLCVLYGAELRLNTTGNNDYLLYGAEMQFFLENPDIFSWKPDKLMLKSREYGFLVYQAHPFRNGMLVVNPENLFGMEICNGKEQEHMRSNLASLWTDKYGLHKIAGSDCHAKDQAAKCGVKFFNPICDNDSLVTALVNNDYYILEKTQYSL